MSIKTVARGAFALANVPSYDTPDDAVRAFMHLVDYRRNQNLLAEPRRPRARPRQPEGPRRD